MLESSREIQIALSLTMNCVDQIPLKMLNVESGLIRLSESILEMSPIFQVPFFFRKHPGWNLGNIREGITNLSDTVSMIEIDHPVVSVFKLAAEKDSRNCMDLLEQSTNGYLNGSRDDIERCVATIERKLREQLREVLLSNMCGLLLNIPMNIIPGCIQLQAIPQKDDDDGGGFIHSESSDDDDSNDDDSIHIESPYDDDDDFIHSESSGGDLG